MHSRDYREVLVADQVYPCAYLSGRVARLPLRMPFDLTPAQFDQLLAQGDRRTGAFLYRTQCPRCKACQPIRVPIREFEPRTTQRRTQRRGDTLLTVEVGPAEVDRQRVDLYNAHRRVRGLDRGEGDIDEDDYRDFLVKSCCRTFEIRYWVENSLKAIAITDLGEKSLSAVYCFYDPHYREVSLGTYSVLKQIDLCRSWGLDYLYLGLYIAESPRMKYKANFTPHERLIDGAWQRFVNG